MELKVGVKILLRNIEGKYLFILRSALKYPTAGAKWDIPGGRINIGESLMDNLNREVGEETGLSVKGETKLLGAQDIFGNDYHTVRLTYIGEASEGNVVLSDEHTEFKWISKDEWQGFEYIPSVTATLKVFLK